MSTLRTGLVCRRQACTPFHNRNLRALNCLGCLNLSNPQPLLFFPFFFFHEAVSDIATATEDEVRRHLLHLIAVLDEWPITMGSTGEGSIR